MDDPLAIRDIAPLIDTLPSGPVWPWIVVPLLVLAAIAILYRLTRRSSPVAAPGPLPPPPTPLECALRDLAALAAEGLVDGRTKWYFTRLNMILRVFLRDECSVQAPRRTTSELIGSEGLAAAIGDDCGKRLAPFLRESDRFKFADITAQPNIARRGHDTCRELVTAIARREVDA